MSQNDEMYKIAEKFESKTASGEGAVVWMLYYLNQNIERVADELSKTRAELATELVSIRAALEDGNNQR